MLDIQRIVFSSGQNAYGELMHPQGQYPTEERHSFKMVQQILDKGLSVKQVAAGNEISLVLTHGGEVWYSGYSELNNNLTYPASE